MSRASAATGLADAAATCGLYDMRRRLQGWSRGIPAGGRGVIFNRTFQHRSGRVISLGRVVLAAVFLVGIWIDPSQPSRLAGTAYAVLGAYLLASVIYFAATWSNWRLEVQLAAPAHVADMVIFGVMVFLTEGYTSPFFSFFVFILLSATIKWGPRVTALSAVVVILLFFAAGLLALELGYGGFELRRFIFRGSYLSVLSLVMIWFSVNGSADRRERDFDVDAIPEGGSAEPHIRQALQHVARETGARRVVMVWWEKEEPWTIVSRLEGGAYATDRYPPGAFGTIVHRRLSGSPFVFDVAGMKALVGGAGRHELVGVSEPIDPRLVQEIEPTEGLCFPVDSHAYAGVVFVLDIAGLCSDDLKGAERLEGAVSSILKRSSMIRLTEESAAARTRLALARDLHDGVAQLLAGTSMRLEALKRVAGSSGAVAKEVDSLQHELTLEQRGLRALIARVREGEELGDATDLRHGIAELADRLSRQWGVACRLDVVQEKLEVPRALEHDVHHLVREAVANAVRHGSATAVSIALEQEGGELRLTVSDNGSGFCSSQSESARPRSLSERVEHLGGSLAVSSESAGSRLEITIPGRRHP